MSVVKLKGNQTIYTLVTQKAMFIGMSDMPSPHSRTI